MDQRPDQPDRSRLKDVHQTDLTESRVNEDFVDWLKTAGPTWLLVALLALCAYLAMVRFRQARVTKVQNAWAELSTAQLPGALEDVASKYDSVGSIDLVAWLSAGDTYLSSVQRGAELGTGIPNSSDPLIPPPPAVELTEEKRAEYLNDASALYQRVIDADDGSNAMTMFAVNAMTGFAIVAECRADADGARTWYEKAAARAEEFYPGLAAQCRDRAASAGELSLHPIKFPATLDLSTVQGEMPPRDPVELDSALRDLIMPDVESSG